jgi:hypothetical protein
MKIELFVLPSVMRRDFKEAFVLSKEDVLLTRPELPAWLEARGATFDEWYDVAYLWDKMSPEHPTVGLDHALAILRAREGTVLFTSEDESPYKACSLLHRGREVFDFVAMADPRELADLIELEWRIYPRLREQAPAEPILPLDLYVFDTTLEWVIVFTHETVSAKRGTDRLCRVFGV